jgi:plastocyanin
VKTGVHLAAHTADAMFGRGLNTAQVGNTVNHIVIPKAIFVKAGGVVDFTVAGFHDIVIFKSGFSLQDLKNAGGGDYPTTPPVYVIPPDPAAPLPSELSSLADKFYYRGINPAGGPAATPATANPSNAVNRAEPVAFLEKGVYLVVCNIRPHLVDGMFAHVLVY